jgi:16S rRNA (cytidine1402-2'-O)-methyltransferase
LNIDISLQQAAAAAAGGQQYPAGALYIVATPIGNLADLSLRAVHVLALADAVACEDTRVSAGLLHHLGLDKPLLSVHAHNETFAARQVLTRLASGQRVAYVSDAGTPCVSDPGAALVAAAQAAGHRVLPIPGPSSALAALSVAGDAMSPGFTFVGFLPTKAGDRRAMLQQLLSRRETQVLFEAPHRIAALLQSLAAEAPERTTTLCRELTKQFETVVTLRAAELPAWLAADPNRSRGEFVLVLHALPPQAEFADALPEHAQRMLQVLLQELPLKQAVAVAATLSGAPRNALYQQALTLRDNPDPGPG